MPATDFKLLSLQLKINSIVLKRYHTEMRESVLHLAILAQTEASYLFMDFNVDAWNNSQL